MIKNTKVRILMIFFLIITFGASSTLAAAGKSKPQQTKIISINNVLQTVAKGSMFALPSKVDALMSGKKNAKVSVKWNVKKADTSTLGTKKYYGMVQGYSKKILLTLNVVDAGSYVKNVDNIEISIHENEPFGLPLMVQAAMADGSKKDCSVVWERDCDSSIIGTTKYYGKIDGYDKKVIAIVNVAPIEKESIPDIVKIIYQGDDYTLPEYVDAQLKDNSFAQFKVIWDSKADSTNAGTYTYTGHLADRSTVKAVITVLSVKEKENMLPIPIMQDGITFNKIEKPYDNIEIRTGVNMDLLFLASYIGANGVNLPDYMGVDDQYGINRAIKEYFTKYASLESAKELYDMVVNVQNNMPKLFAGHILEGTFRYDENAPLPLDFSDETLVQLKQFALDSNANEFFKKNSYLYDNMMKEFLSKLNFNHVERLDEFFGKDMSKDKFLIVLSTITNGGQADFINNEDGTKTYYNLMNPFQDWDNFCALLYHETTHNIYDIRVENGDLIEQYSQYKDAIGHNYNYFPMDLNETLARAVTIIMLEKYNGKDAAEKNLESEEKQGYKNLGNIVALIKNKYLPNRDKYKTFKDFAPQIFEFIKAESLHQPFDIGTN